MDLKLARFFKGFDLDLPSLGKDSAIDLLSLGFRLTIVKKVHDHSCNSVIRLVMRLAVSLPSTEIYLALVPGKII